ncbi:MAG TPA: SDR family oxidoreductase [Candidatus Binatia bacterium]|jgi:3-oxoacyl-[acyl-carrier protein] reductase
MNLDGKAAVITGGGTGVGRATALMLAGRGCSVAVNYSKSKQAAEETAAEARALGVRAIAVQADVAADDDCRRLAATATAELGRIDVLVANAGTTEFIAHHELDRLTPQVWQRILGVNLIGPFQCARAVKAAMDSAGGGAIVMTSSIAGTNGVGSSIPYCASKAALNNLTLTLARALGPSIRVNAVAPGFIRGRWLQEGYGESYEMIEQLATARAVLKKVCEPEDVAAAIVALVTNDLITGQVHIIDGGLTIGQ